MSLYSKLLIRLSYSLAGRSEMNLYDELTKTALLSFEELEQRQNIQLRSLINFSYANIKYYRELFKSLKLTPEDFKTTQDLNKLPILTKEIIQKNSRDFLPAQPYSKYFNCKTGGSTGQSMAYRCSDTCYSMGVALMYRGWGYAGYEPGDPVFFFGGGSIIKDHLSFRAKMSFKTRNIYPYSSFGVSTEDYKSIFEFIHRHKPKFFRGYSSAITLLAKTVMEQGGIERLGIERPKAIFTTADMLLPNQRHLIEEVFQCQVYNNYGLNDGGIGAYENRKVDGFLVDPERSYMETVDKDFQSIFLQSGTILATSLHNFDFPFIRYDTGDLGILSKEHIKEGTLNKVILMDLQGRSSDYLTINGKTITAPGLTVIMGKFDIWKYQIVQNSACEIDLLIDKGPSYNDTDEVKLRESLVSFFGNVTVTFYYDREFLASGNKHKFIIDLTKN